MLQLTTRSILIAVMLLLFAGCYIQLSAQSDSELEKTRAKAFKLTSEQKFIEALPLLEQLSIDLPDDARVFFNLGFSLIAKVNVTKDENEQRVLRIRARKAFIRAKELRIQEPVVDALIQGLSPDGAPGAKLSADKDAERHLREGEASFSRGNHDDALKSYEKALKLDPNFYEAALYSGDVYVTQNKFDRAEEFYQRAISINPERETAYRYSATPLMRQKMFDAARDRYVEAYITEPYSRFATGGLTQWAQATRTSVGHPRIAIPETSEDSEGNITVELGPEAKLAGNPEKLWSHYATARSKWRKGEFVKTHPGETTYRRSLAEETASLRAVIAAFKADKSGLKPDPSFTNLVRLEEQGLLESYVLLANADEGISYDHPKYLKTNRDKLRRYVREFVIASGESTTPEGSTPAGTPRTASRVATEYNAAEDKTEVKIALEPVTCVPGACVFYSLETSFPGKTSAGKIEHAVFAIALFTKSTKPAGAQDLSIRVDDKRFDLGSMELAGDESRDGLRVLIYGTSLSEREISAIATAKRVEMKLGSIEFPLVETNIRSIAEFYAAAKGAK